MPKTCKLFSPDIMHRDFFKCNPTNTNHYQYPKFETLSYDVGCHPHEVERILKRDERNMYVIFYTRYTNLMRKSKNRVVGYFKVGEKILRPKLGFKSSESVLLPRKECKRTHYSSRPALVSWGNSPLKIKIEISRVLRYLKGKKNSAKNIVWKYQSETRRVMKQLGSATGRMNIVKTCERCRANGRCYWGRIKDKEIVLEKLYNRKHRC